MLYLCVLAALAVSTSLAMPQRLERRELEFLFESWRLQNSVDYESAAEYIKRMEVFGENHWFITLHNSMNASYTLGHNEFSDQTWEEFRSTMLGFGNVPETHYQKRKELFKDVDPTTLMGDVDWVSAGAVTPVKNQGQCGSCWSFSTTGAIEGAMAITTGQLVSLSEQNLVDCDTACSGCNGGLMDNGFIYAGQNGGLCAEEAYPYVAAQQACMSSQCQPVPGSAPAAYSDVAQSAQALMAAIAQQPTSVAIEADQQAFQFYAGGVMTAPCGNAIDHGVLAVGYGTDFGSGYDYWKIKNSWGATWGEQGYIRLARGYAAQPGGNCGIYSQASIPDMN